MKDPAALIYFDKWISSTNGKRAEYRAWYLDLLLYQYDKGSLPDDMDELAGICRVRPSEYDLFKQVLKQVLEQRFEQNEDGRYINTTANEVLRKREQFKDKRQKSGTIGAVVKLAKSIRGFKSEYIVKLKSELYSKEIKEIKTYQDKQVLKQMLKLYINVDVDVDNMNNSNSSTSVDKKVYRKFAHLSLSEEEFKELRTKGYTKQEIDTTLDDIENYRQNTKYSSLKMTCRNWMDRNRPASDPDKISVLQPSTETKLKPLKLGLNKKKEVSNG